MAPGKADGGWVMCAPRGKKCLLGPQPGPGGLLQPKPIRRAHVPACRGLARRPAPGVVFAPVSRDLVGFLRGRPMGIIPVVQCRCVGVVYRAAASSCCLAAACGAEAAAGTPGPADPIH